MFQGTIVHVQWHRQIGDPAAFYWNKGECNLNQSKDDSVVKQVAKNDNWNNGDQHKIHEIFLINYTFHEIVLVLPYKQRAIIL